MRARDNLAQACVTSRCGVRGIAPRHHPQGRRPFRCRRVRVGTSPLATPFRDQAAVADVVWRAMVLPVPTRGADALADSPLLAPLLMDLRAVFDREVLSQLDPSTRAVFGRAGVKLGSSWGQAGLKLGSTWRQPGVKLGSSWGQPGVNLGTTCSPTFQLNVSTFCWVYGWGSSDKTPQIVGLITSG